MIRPMQAHDAPDVLALLNWMDDAPEREVFAPDARALNEFQLECEDSLCFVQEGEDGVLAYCALSPFRGGLVLEGPLADPGGALALGALTARAVQSADGLPVYAFCARDNVPVRAALEAAGLTPMHTTDFYGAPVSGLARAARTPEGHLLGTELPFEVYRWLYRASEDTWAGRLDWTPEQYDAHCARPDVRLLALWRGEQAVAFAEMELCPEEGRADLTHIAVHPAERGQGLGRALLHLSAAELTLFPEVRTLRARAHDHMRAARALYARAGMTHCRSIVTYLLEGEEEA
jgi:ribosomal protein S18 acetylase RimI-like enzyme